MDPADRRIYVAFEQRRMAYSRCEGVNVEGIALTLSALAVNKHPTKGTRPVEVIEA
jgi:hypothetical protein